MNPHAYVTHTLQASPTATMADWADTLVRGARESLDRMETTLTLTEAKVALIRHLRARRREWENARQR